MKMRQRHKKYKVLTLKAVILYSRLQQVRIPVIDFSIYCLKMT